MKREKNMRKVKKAAYPLTSIFYFCVSVAAQKSDIIIVEIPKPPTTCDFLMNNLWILLIAYAAIMSYRFFSGRAMDFRDMWEEYHGKK